MSRGRENWRKTQTPTQGHCPAQWAQQSGGHRSPHYHPAHTGTHPQGRGNAYQSVDWRNRPEQVHAAPSRARESSSTGSSLLSTSTPSPVAPLNASGLSSLESSLCLDTPSPGFLPLATKRAVRPKHELVEMGRIYNLPSLGWNSPARQASTELGRHLHVNERAGDHPTLVWDVYEREGDKVQVARCLQVTSFRVDGVHRTIEEKYPSPTGNAWKWQCQYLPIQHHEGTTSATNQPILRLLDGNMSYQSYVHLDHFFEIEAYLLLPFGTRPLVLDFWSLNVVLTKLRQFVTGIIWRPKYNPGGKVPKSPLDTHLGQCGFANNLSEEVEYREELGWAVEIEIDRLAALQEEDRGFARGLPAEDAAQSFFDDAARLVDKRVPSKSNNKAPFANNNADSAPAPAPKRHRDSANADAKPTKTPGEGSSQQNTSNDTGEGPPRRFHNIPSGKQSSSNNDQPHPAEGRRPRCD